METPATGLRDFIGAGVTDAFPWCFVLLVDPAVFVVVAPAAAPVAAAGTGA